MGVILESFKEDDERIHLNALQFLNHGLKKKDGKARSTYAFMNKKALKSKRDKLLKKIKKKKQENKDENEGGASPLPPHRHRKKRISMIKSEKSPGKGSGRPSILPPAQMGRQASKIL
jgi:hypothetical protein